MKKKERTWFEASHEEDEYITLSLGCVVTIVLFEFVGLLCLQVAMRSDLEIVLGFTHRG